MSKLFEKKHVFIFFTLLSVILATPCFSAERGKSLFNLCISCHGVNGAGLVEAGAPAIAGLPEYYIESQLVKFYSNARGAHPDDDNGNRMRPMARTLEPEDFKPVSEYVATLKPVAPASTLSGDPAKGKVSYAVCASCHGSNAEGNPAMHAPPLKYSNDWYLVTQLAHFKAKIRASDPTVDPVGSVMTGMAGTLADEQAMKDVVSYIQSLK